MMVAWLTYCLLVSALLGLSAAVAERALRWQGWPGRWVWAGALAGSIGLPAWAWLGRGAPAGADVAVPLMPLPGSYVMEVLPALALSPAGTAAPSLELVLGWGWALSSLLVLGWLAVSGLRLRAAGRRWPTREVAGVPVLVSESTGPAALGLFRGRVVLPAWTLSLDERSRRLLVLHEAEHLRARDPQVAVTGLLACGLMPWNPALWLQLVRLRLAIEVDCDARVLRRSGDTARYGSLLLAVGQQRSRLALGMSESKTMLERRIRMMTRVVAGRRTVRALGLGAVAVVMLAVACETPAPTGLADAASRPVDSDQALTSVAALPCEPVVYVDGDRGDRSMLDALDPEAIETVEVVRGRAALRVDRLELEPADRAAATRPSPECGVIFVTRHGASSEAREQMRRVREELRGPPREPLTVEQVRDGPTFTPMTIRPQLRNVRTVQQVLMSHYPPLLRDAGIGGTANVWFLIDEEGQVQRTLIHQSAGHDALDQAALRVAGTMEFSPAYNRDVRVPVWVSLPITFEATARAEPTFTPMTVRPMLRNVREVQEQLMRHYPPLLRDAGIGGTTSIWLLVDTGGEVRQVMVNETSGHPALDQAAMQIAQRMSFQPARNGDEVVTVWISLPITFEIQ